MAAYDAFLLVSFGGPEGPDEVMPFLENVTRGRGVPPERLASVAEHYYAVGGVSPINQQCRDLLAAVRADFAARGLSLPVYWGNRNWDPYLSDTVRAMAADGVRQAVAFATAAYSSYSSCRQYLDDIERARAAAGPDAPRIDKIRRFFNHPGFIEPFAASARAALATLPAGVREDARLVFTAHSIPEAMAEASGPGGGRRYVAELTEAAGLIAERAGGGTHPWTLAYQSRSGPLSQPWLGPDVCDHLAELARAGTRAVVVIPVGFVSDHMEVVHDLDVEAARSADSLGLAFARAATPGTDPRFASMITDLVLERVALTESPEPGSPAPDNPAPDNPAPDNPAPDNPAPDNPAPDNPAPDNPAPDNKALDSTALDSTALDNPVPGNPLPGREAGPAGPAALGGMGVPSQDCPAGCCRYTRPPQPPGPARCDTEPATTGTPSHRAGHTVGRPGTVEGTASA